MMDWSLRNVVYAAFWFGEFHSECYYCDETLSSRNLLALNLKIPWHLAWTHDKDPDELPDSEVEAVSDYMSVYSPTHPREQILEDA